MLGLPTYGRSYTLLNPADTSIGASSDGPGKAGKATKEDGYLAYYEVSQKLGILATKVIFSFKFEFWK